MVCKFTHNGIRLVHFLEFRLVADYLEEVAMERRGEEGGGGGVPPSSMSQHSL